MSSYKSPGRSPPTRSPGLTKSSGTLTTLTGAGGGAAGKLAACLAYGAVSVSITMFNKAVFSVYHFQYPAFVTTLQVRGGAANFVSIRRMRGFGSPRACVRPPPLVPQSRQHTQATVPAAGAGVRAKEGAGAWGSAEHKNDAITLPPTPHTQVALSIVFMLALSFFRVLDIGPVPTVASAKAVAPLAGLWMLYVQSGVIALRHLTVPMYSVLRRSTTLLVVIGEYLAFGKVPTPPAAASIGAMAAGAALAGSADLSFSPVGYAWVGVCVVSTAAYLILIRLLGDKTGKRDGEKWCVLWGRDNTKARPTPFPSLPTPQRPEPARPPLPQQPALPPPHGRLVPVRHG